MPQSEDESGVARPEAVRPREGELGTEVEGFW